MQIKLELIVAVCENMGIGLNGNLPWRLKSEMAYFTKMTTKTIDNNKKNVVIMGRKTWESIPSKFKPLNNRINVVLSNTLTEIDDNVHLFKDLNSVIQEFSKAPMKDKIERMWVIGGSSVYKAALESPYFHRLYITRIKKDFLCDTFFPSIPKNCTFISDSEVPDEVMEENGIQYKFEVYEAATGTSV